MPMMLEMELLLLHQLKMVNLKMEKQQFLNLRMPLLQLMKR
ncbi:hypothetical protein LINGRAHAP2_LOCUS36656 [Linum grandiflorum]